MVQINFARKEVSCKLVYYGPGMSGKTTNLEVIHKKVPAKNKGELTSIATEGERTLFFDFLPLDLGTVSGMKTKFQLYTVPGQVYYSSTRRLVLQGADGIIFVADSQKDKLKENIESIQDLKDNLSSYGIDLENIPLIIQYNKRDLPDVMDIDHLEKEINAFNAPYFEAVAVTGKGVINTLKAGAKLVLEQLNKKAGQPVKKDTPKTAYRETDEHICEIDNEKVLKKDFDRFCLTRMKMASQKNKRIENITEEEKKRYLDLLINQIIIFQEAKKRDIDVEETEIKDQIKQFSAKLGSEGKFHEYLTQRDLTLENIKNDVIKNILTSKLTKILFPDYKKRIAVNESEVKGYYDTNKDTFENEFEESRRKAENMLKNKKKKDLLDNFYSKIREGKNISIS